MELETLQDLYIYELKDLYSAERQLVQALPKMVHAAHNAQLSAGIQKHLEQQKSTRLAWKKYYPVISSRPAERNAKEWRELLLKVLK